MGYMDPLPPPASYKATIQKRLVRDVLIFQLLCSILCSIYIFWPLANQYWSADHHFESSTGLHEIVMIY